MRIHNYERLPPIKPGVGQSTALHALPAAQNSALIDAACPVNIFPPPPPPPFIIIKKLKHNLTCSTNSESHSYLWSERWCTFLCWLEIKDGKPHTSKYQWCSFGKQGKLLPCSCRGVDLGTLFAFVRMYILCGHSRQKHCDSLCWMEHFSASSQVSSSTWLRDVFVPKMYGLT